MIKIAELLSEGAENARTARELSQVTGYALRDVTELIEYARRNGTPICASTGSTPGYFIAASKQEMIAYCDSLKRRALEILATRQACIDTLNILPEGEQ